MTRPTKEQTIEAIRTLLTWIGEDPNRKGLAKTPERFLKACEEYFSGYGRDPASVLSAPLKKDIAPGYDDMVLLTKLHFYSHCEHHMALIKGFVHIGYIPGEHLLGLSKMAHLVEIYARRLQTQERMTRQIAVAMMKHLAPRGVAVRVEAQHHCMIARGVAKEGSQTTTNTFLGLFEKEARWRKHFSSQIHTSPKSA